LRWWFLGLPAGIGMATLKASLKLWLGFSPVRSGVFSAGNGPAIRGPILGAAIDDIERLRLFVDASTRVTHTDPKANQSAFSVALAAWCAKRGKDTPGEIFGLLRSLSEPGFSDEFNLLMEKVEQSIATGVSTEDFARQLGCGQWVSGYMYHTVPVVLHSWLSHPRDCRRAVKDVIACGGDTDTTAAIVGSIIGSAVGRAGIPQEWLARLWEWPRTVAWMCLLSEATERAVKRVEPKRPPQILPLVGLARNAVFLSIVMGHVARRLLPPY
jgi:ADP-ribosyl-[dinitrogen reductase] hydrolase